MSFSIEIEETQIIVPNKAASPPDKAMLPDDLLHLGAVLLAYSISASFSAGVRSAIRNALKSS
jgi:hypothetical protein